MRSVDFFEAHPVFRHEEYLADHTASGRSSRTSNNLLAMHLAAGRLLRVRRGLYAVVSHRAEGIGFSLDPYLVASNVTDDAVIAFHAALQFFGKAYSVWKRFHYLTAKRARPFSFRDLEFVPVQASPALRSLPDDVKEVTEVRHAEGRVRVTTLERTLVDVLDDSDKGGGWEEIWRSLEMVEFFDLHAVISYVRALGSAISAARVGFFLEQHRESLMVEDKHLEALRALAPTQPRYLDGSRKSGRLVRPWNLVVPEYVLNRRWEEQSDALAK
jgi:predicted transcriptional regulator of viral defense system